MSLDKAQAEYDARTPDDDDPRADLMVDVSDTIQCRLLNTTKAESVAVTMSDVCEVLVASTPNENEFAIQWGSFHCVAYGNNVHEISDDFIHTLSQWASIL